MCSFILPLFIPTGAEWIVILIVVLLLFGGKKIPELLKGMGKGIRNFKDGIEGKDENKKE
ncbi:MAG: twin-arginine translocase TatA/TatE family subunit [Bacteroidales bacterium]|nr:twin-arginine translocase TatA/TatE family subunit [Bacteroidales bacterium]